MQFSATVVETKIHGLKGGSQEFDKNGSQSRFYS